MDMLKMKIVTYGQKHILSYSKVVINIVIIIL